MMQCRKCKLINITDRKERSGSVFHLQDTENNSTYDIIVDETPARVTDRLNDGINGSREKLYFSRGMTDIDVNIYKEEWDINEETDTIYQFKRDDVIQLLENYRNSK